MKTLIKNVRLLDMVSDEPKCETTNILIEQNKIVKIDPKIDEKTDIIINGKDLIAIPGLINTHTHTGMSIFRGYQDDRNLMDWLKNVILPKEDKLCHEDIYWLSKLSIIEMIKSGTTTFNDMYFNTEATLKAIQETGVRAEISWCVTDNSNKDKYNETIKYHNENKNSRIKIGVSLHAPYTCNPKTITKFLELAQKINTNIHVHLAETKEEIKTIKQIYNKTPTEYLNDLGVFNVPVMLAHGIYLSDSDINILKKIQGGISHNPISNCKLVSGICDIVKLRKNGINVGIGTDGQGSSTTLDMFEQMKVAAYLQKIKHEDPTCIKAYDILKMATIDGAKVLGLDKEIGTIEVGKKADIILINTNKPHLQPDNDICTNLVYSANGQDVDTVIIDGNIIMKNQKLINIDQDEIIKNTRKIAKNIL